MMYCNCQIRVTRYIMIIHNIELYFYETTEKFAKKNKISGNSLKNAITIPCSKIILECITSPVNNSVESKDQK